MVISTTTSASFSELLDYMQFAFPEQSFLLEEKNELVVFIEQREQEYGILYLNLFSNISNTYFSEEEKTYLCSRTAMCEIYNTISNLLEPVLA